MIWFSGLPCSGKSTLSKKLLGYVPNMEILDGDSDLINALRSTERSKESRIIHAGRVAYLAKLLLKHKIPVCVSLISPYIENRETARKIIGNDKFVEIFIKCSLEECKSRDVKGMYKKAQNNEIKNFTGISDKYEEPTNPDIVLETEKLSAEESVSKIILYLKNKNIICN